MEPLPAPPWRKTRPAKPAKPQLNQELIVETGLRIVDREGLDALSMRKVAQELDTGPASLYAHVANKEELLELIYERVLGDIEVPAPEPERWAEQLREVVIDMHRELNSHADVAKVSLARVPLGPNSLRLGEAMLAIMIEGGVPPAIAAIALDRIVMFVAADAYEGSLYTTRQRTSGMDVETFVADSFGQVADYVRALPADRFPYFTRYADELVNPGGEERFELGLDLMIAGLATHVRSG
ncbi:TetR/AcrR family transcriptional regulator C-terminal domain-containing protein [Nonomuraea sp. NPDC059194]|uniref:TetR/AcrR family transcriptional regulator C-terminal domain-containing protein n=1 Tax=Nonomuraea sp. NPDC059194 TaxID=3346764 RepID=UPI003680CB24